VAAGSKGSIFLGLVVLVLVVGGIAAAGPENVGRFFRLLRDVRGLVQWGGYAVLAVIIFAETGLLIGFFLPGDSLLVTAGIFAAPDAGLLDIFVLNALLIPLAIAGDALNYSMGVRTGPAIFKREDSRFFKKAYLERTQRFYERHGGKTIIIARFVPIVRTFAPFVAGMGKMGYRRFATFNVVGAMAWVASMTFTGYALASLVPDIERYLHVVIGVVIVLSILPGAFEVWRARRSG